MLTLCGFAVSNYYNKVKLVLLEKGLPFDEKLAWLGETDRSCSPLGKVPYLLTDDGALAESTVITEYLEARYPSPALLPRDPFQAAKVRELLAFLELHVELVARVLYTEAFFGGTLSDEVKQQTASRLGKHVKAFATLARFDPYLGGDSFTVADCAAAFHLPLISLASKMILGRDVLADLPVRPYLELLGRRETVQRAHADRKLHTEWMVARRNARQAAPGT